MSKYAKWLREDRRKARKCRADGEIFDADFYDDQCKRWAMLLIWGVPA